MAQLADVLTQMWNFDQTALRFSNLAEFGKNWANLGIFGKIWVHLCQFWNIWPSLGTFGSIWECMCWGRPSWRRKAAPLLPRSCIALHHPTPSTLYIILLLFISSIGRSLRYHSLLQIAAGHSRLGGMTPPPLLRQPDHDPRE